MEQLQQQIITNGRIDDSTLQEQQVLTQPVERTKQERSYWEQKSCINLLREGEHNTSFSHISTIQHHRRNRITNIKTNEVRILEIHKDMETELADYFEDMLTKNEQERATSIQEVTSHIPSLVTEQQNATLMRPTMLSEVTISSNQMKVDKAPFPDDFIVNFFHACWDVLKLEVLDLVEESKET